MKHDSKQIILDFNLPGYKKEDVKVKIDKNFIEIHAEKKDENHVQKKDFFHSEKSYKSFSYSTTIPEINPKKAKIKFNKGKLEIIAPRK